MVLGVVVSVLKAIKLNTNTIIIHPYTHVSHGQTQADTSIYKRCCSCRHPMLAMRMSEQMHIYYSLIYFPFAAPPHLHLHLDPPILDKTMGSKSLPSASVCSHSPNAVPIDSSVHQVFFKCRLPSLRWTTSSSATTTRGPWHGVIGWTSRWHPDDMACHPKSSICYNVL